jgi:hypothetical protein
LYLYFYIIFKIKEKNGTGHFKRRKSLKLYIPRGKIRSIKITIKTSPSGKN